MFPILLHFAFVGVQFFIHVIYRHLGPKSVCFGVFSQKLAQNGRAGRWEAPRSTSFDETNRMVSVWGWAEKKIKVLTSSLLVADRGRRQYGTLWQYESSCACVSMSNLTQAEAAARDHSQGPRKGTPQKTSNPGGWAQAPRNECAGAPLLHRAGPWSFFLRGLLARGGGDRRARQLLRRLDEGVRAAPRRTYRLFRRRGAARRGAAGCSTGASLFHPRVVAEARAGGAAARGLDGGPAHASAGSGVQS